MNAVIAGSKERTLPTDRNRYEFDRIYRFVAENYGAPEKIALDYGCGSGYGTAYLANHFGTIYGIDISTEAVAACRECYSASNLRFQVLNPNHQPFPEGSFDFIGSFQVFEHIPLEGVPDFIRYIWLMLRKDGVAIITTPNANNYFGGQSGNPFHIKEYKLEELKSAVSQQIDLRNFEIFATADVPSTAIRNYVRRSFRASQLGEFVARWLSLPVALAERYGLVSISNSPIIKGNRDDVMGGFLVEIHKTK